jgi:dTDP-4-dehydrorhamnose 3,5-epimerase-like enzyme
MVRDVDDVHAVSGGSAEDERGVVLFVNDLDLSAYRRLYVVANHRVGEVRAWHGHRHEGKAVIVVRGSALVAAVRVDDWDDPSPDLPVVRRVLSAEAPEAMVIPPGHANGCMTLTEDARVLYLSTTTLAESLADDIRFDPSTWAIGDPSLTGPASR